MAPLDTIYRGDVRSFEKLWWEIGGKDQFEKNRLEKISPKNFCIKPLLNVSRCEGWESPCVDTASERGDGLEWDRHFFASTLPYFCGTWCLVFEVWSGAEVIAWVSFLVFSHYLANIVYRDIKAISRDLYNIFVLITGWCLTENKLSLHSKSHKRGMSNLCAF